MDGLIDWVCHFKYDVQKCRSITITNLNFPVSLLSELWEKHFRPCAVRLEWDQLFVDDAGDQHLKNHLVEIWPLSPLQGPQDRIRQFFPF
jgi:hypothetical protein